MHCILSLSSHVVLGVWGHHPGELGGFGGLQVIRVQEEKRKLSLVQKTVHRIYDKKDFAGFFLSVQALFHKFSADLGWDRMPFMLQYDAMELAAFLLHSPTLNGGQTGRGK